MGLSFKNDPTHIIPENFETDIYKVTGFKLIWKSLYVMVVMKEGEEFTSNLKYRRVLHDMMRSGRRI